MSHGRTEKHVKRTNNRAFVGLQKSLESVSEQLRIPGSKSLGPIGQVSGTAGPQSCRPLHSASALMHCVFSPTQDMFLC